MKLIALASALMLAAPIAASAQPYNPAPAQPRLMFTAVGEAAGSPEQATLMIQITNQANTAEHAVEATANETAAVVEALRKHGVDRQDIESAAPSITKQLHQPNAPPYVTHSTIRVVLRRLDRIGVIYDAIAAAGADNVSRPAFSMKDPAPLRTEARRRAMASAEQTAREYAAAGGWRSVRLVQIVEGEDRLSLLAGNDLAFGAGAASLVVQDEVKVTIRLSVTYEFER